MEIKIGLLSSGAILVDGQEADLAQLDSRLARANRAQDVVLYYKEDLGPGGTARSMEIVKLVVKHKLAVRLSTKPDYSDAVDRFGNSAPRTIGPAPAVNLQRDWRDVFAEARAAASKMPDGRGVGFVGIDRRVWAIPVPARSAAMDARVPKVPDIPADRPRSIAVIAGTGGLSGVPGKPPDLREAAKAIPFLGMLIGLGYVGHRVWIFEGRPPALAAGLEQAEILLIDAEMLPFLQSDWMALAQRVMAPPRRVLIQKRTPYTLMAARPAKTPPGWAYAEPDGEASYVNCLLTTLAKAGSGATAEIVGGAPLPHLAEFTRDSSQLEWIEGLPFRYEQMDAGRAIEALTSRRDALQQVQKEWVFKALLAAEGRQRACEFTLRLDDSKPALSIRVI